MGYYINKLPSGEYLPKDGKADKLLSIDGAVEIPEPTTWQEGLVCVVKNPSWEAAGYAFSEDEMEAFKEFDGRPKRWLLIPNAKLLVG